MSSDTDAAITPAVSAERLDALVRDDDRTPDAYFDTLEAEAAIDGTQTKMRWHRVCHAATFDRPDLIKLVDKAFNLLIDFACSRKELANALANASSHSPGVSGQAFAALQEKARRLFVSSSTTGEIGEVILYYLAEHLLRYPQLLCKFPHKTNPEVHAHGADGVHASVDPQTGHLRLHWGEAKLHGNLSKAMDECFSSLSELILEPPDAKKTKRRDIELLRDYIALNDPGLEQAVRNYLDPEDVRSNKVKFCGIALVGFDLADYSSLTEQVARKDANAIALRTARWKEQFKAAIEKHELVSVTIDAFCIPFECVQELRDAFLNRLGVGDAN